MLVYIYTPICAEKLYFCLSVHHSNNTPGLQVQSITSLTQSIHHPPTPSLLLRVHTCFHLLCKVSWRKRCRENLSYILKTTTQPIRHLTCIQWVQSCCWHFSLVSIPLVHIFLQPNFSSSHFGIQSTYRCSILAKSHALHLATWITVYVPANQCGSL